MLGVLKARVSPEQMPVLITTSGNCLPEDVAYYSSCGADDTFGKPFYRTSTIWDEGYLLY